MSITKPSTEVIYPEWDAPENVHALFTLRSGGLSAGPWGGEDGFNGLNLANHVGDSPFAVKMNRQFLRSWIPSEPKWLNQIHSTEVVVADQIENPVDADASITTNSNVVCVVMTADCLPILLTDRQGCAVSAVHAGWRGLVQGIIQKSVEEMRKTLADPEAEIMAWIGPCIRRESFEVQEDVAQIFRESSLSAVANTAISQNGSSFLLDLPAFAKEALRLQGVTQVFDSGCNTYTDAKRFYSYRRDGDCGRHATLIWKD